VAGAAGIHNRRNSRPDAEDIRVGSEGAEAVHQMKMDVDQTWCNNKTFDVNEGRAFGLEIGSNCRDDAVADMNIVLPVEATPRIEQSAAFQDEIA
jgi:hypothetical protein